MVGVALDQTWFKHLCGKLEGTRYISPITNRRGDPLIVETILCRDKSSIRPERLVPSSAISPCISTTAISSNHMQDETIYPTAGCSWQASFGKRELTPMNLLYQMPEGTDIKQFLEVRFIFHIQDDIFTTFNLGIRQYILAILAINIYHLIHA